MTRDQREIIHAAFLEYSKLLVQHAMRYIYDDRIAERLVQDTFLIACEKPDEFCTHEKPLAWLFTVLNFQIKKEKQRSYHQEKVYHDELDYRAATEEDPLEFSLPADLDADERELLILRIEKQWSFAQIAEYKGIREDACRQKFQRTKKKCQKLLAKR